MVVGTLSNYETLIFVQFMLFFMIVFNTGIYFPYFSLFHCPTITGKVKLWNTKV